MANRTIQKFSVNENLTNRNDLIYVFNPAAPYFRYSHFVTTYLFNNKGERRATCPYLRTNHHNNILQPRGLVVRVSDY